MNTKIANEITGGLSEPRKLPCRGYSIPAVACKIGSLLHQKSGSVCSDCYARKGRYMMPYVVAALEKRLASLDHPKWVQAMVYLIPRVRSRNQPKGERPTHFRWHDSGDIQNERHLERIFEVCRLTPQIQHWLPSHEYALCKRMLPGAPANLVIRLSAPMVNVRYREKGIPTCGVVTEKPDATCRAFENDGKCGDCRKCWNPKVRHVDYLKH